MKFENIMVLVVCGIAMFIGCRDSNEEITSVVDNKVLVVVNGVPYSENDLESELELRKVLLQRMPKKKSMLSENGIRKLRQHILRSVLTKTALQSEIQKLKISVEPAALAAQEEKISTPFMKKRETIDQFRSYLAENGVYNTFRAVALHEASVNALLRVKYTNELDITEIEIDRAMAHAKKYNESASKKNNEIYLMATNIVRQASRGANFSELAKRYSKAEKEEVDNGGHLGEWDKSDCDHIAPDLWEKISGLPDGAVTDVIETDVALYIFKVNKRILNSEMTGNFALDLSRIELHRVVLYEDYTREEVRVMGLKQARSLCLNKELKFLYKNLAVETPAGTNQTINTILEVLKKKGKTK